MVHRLGAAQSCKNVACPPNAVEQLGLQQVVSEPVNVAVYVPMLLALHYRLQPDVTHWAVLRCCSLTESSR